MTTAETRILDMFTRVREFGLLYTAAFPAGSLATRLFAELSLILQTLSAHAVSQSSERRTVLQSTGGKAAVRRTLQNELAMIARTARALALDLPGLEDKFRLPRTFTEQGLLTTARTFRTDSETLEAKFVDHDMPGDFLETLDSLIAEFEQLVATSHQSATARVAATAGIDTDIDRGLKIARQLDAIVRNKFHNDPAMLAAWLSARHIERAPHKSPKKPVDPQPSSDKSSH